MVVGTDGSEQSSTALRWAARFAAHHRAPLRIVYVIDVPVEYGPGLSGPLFDQERLREHGESVVAAGAAAAAEVVGPIDIPIETVVATGTIVSALRHHSASARLVVVGSRGHGAIRRTLLGSVSTSLARHSECPVAVIPEEEADPGGSVVVGVDGSACSADAVAIAFEEACLRGVRLVAVHAWSEFFRYDSRAIMQTEGEALLAESLAGYAEKYPDVEVGRVVVEDKPARAVLDSSATAQLVVVGSHGRGGFSGMTLGSVAQAVLHGVACPLIVARCGAGAD
ncbi:universal stress protein [Nocardia sp. MW-W600-9]